MQAFKAFYSLYLSVYLQNRTPNVPDIAGRLIKSPVRKPLNQQCKAFWDLVVNELRSMDCIYTNASLRVGNYAVEHFLS